ncbi:Usher syndrome type-1C protein-binding protein [Quillaja saponaria]|uniref:Usher syndrome type-1C protein-binding protein n=1 Tax=Quillaja saponaria TaxID=32244 RepID=A0AAD7PEL4_QUISA|nr:Usher syndrome type-1C protein-binding protein [Quillaja saponaria]
MIKKARKESLLIRVMKAPIKVLSKARDLYIQSMTECSGHFDYGAGAMGCPAVQVSTLPRSFSFGSTKSNMSDDYKELIKAASTRNFGNKIELDILQKQQPIGRQSPATVPRSQSVGIGRIDEDKPCDFGEEFKLKNDMYPRSRSYAVLKRTGILSASQAIYIYIYI